jgi:iron complex outermembrane receptor protein
MLTKITTLRAIAVLAVLAPMVALAEEPSLEEIVVTARKRAETLQDVPLAVSVLDGASLQDNHIDTVDDLYGRVPGLYFTNSGGAAPTSDFIYLILRGVGFNGGQEPATGVFIDGMYQPQLGYDIDFLDLERLEVLRGPQGTLFGRNTEAGALNLVTRKPDQNFAGRLELEGGRFDTYRTFGSVRGPIADTLFGGLSAQVAGTSGYMKNLITGGNAIPERKYAVRGTLRWVPTDQFEASLAADFSHRTGNEMALGSPLSCHCYNLYADDDQDDTGRNDGLQLTAEWKPSTAFTLTSITGYRAVKTDTTIDFDGLPTDQTPVTANGHAGSLFAGPFTFSGISQFVAIDQRFWSQEIRLAGSVNRVDWLVGAYGFKEEQEQVRQFDIAGVVADPAISFLVPTTIHEDFLTDRRGWAVFGQASWRPLEQLELTGGTRLSDETVSIGGQRLRNIVQIENANPTFFTLAGEKSFNNVSPTGSVSWQFDKTVKAYVTVSEGWKAGGFNRFPSTANAALPYDAETSLNYELGLKSAWPEQHLSANLALFYIDIDKQQLLTVTPDSNGVPVTTITNAGKSRSRGAELEVFARPAPRLDLSLSIAYTDARFVDFTERAAGGSFVVRNGQRFEFVPQLTGSASAEYRFPIGDGRDLAVNLTNRYVGNYVVPDGSFLADLGATVPVKSYDRLDLRATYAMGTWKVSGYVRNLLDSFDYTNIAYDAFVAETPSSLFVTPLEPRTYSVTVSKTF